MTEPIFHHGLEHDLIRLERLLAQRIAAADAPDVDAMLESFLARPGKRFRASMVFRVGRACGSMGSRHDDFAVLVELIHRASLIHDDILDNGQRRHHRPTAARQWGTQRALLLGDYLFGCVFDQILALDNAALARRMIAVVSGMCLGELTQQAHRDTWPPVTADAYDTIVVRKTAALMGLSAYLGAVGAGADAVLCQQFQQWGLPWSAVPFSGSTIWRISPAPPSLRARPCVPT